MSVRKKVDLLLQRFEKEFLTHNLVEISSFALSHNADYFLQLTNVSVIPVVKSNAYGHGIEQVAQILAMKLFPYVAVDSYYEALQIREVSDQPILIMGAVDPRNFRVIKVLDFSFVVSDQETIHAIGNTGRKITIHLEINSGMNRYGASIDELPSLLETLKLYPNLTLEGVMSHLADSDGTDQSTVDEAVALFDEAVELVQANGFQPTLFHIAQSAGSVRAHSKYANALRLGIGLYGINPFPPDHEQYEVLQKHLLPALQLKSTVTQIHQLEPGDRVSYNYTFTAEAPMRLGVLPIGYGDGLDRASLSNAGMVKLGNVYCPIVGKICMNHTMINLEGTDANVGDTVIIYSHNPHDHNSISSLSREFGLFSYEMLTSISPAIRRRIVH